MILVWRQSPYLKDAFIARTEGMSFRVFPSEGGFRMTVRKNYRLLAASRSVHSTLELAQQEAEAWYTDHEREDNDHERKDFKEAGMNPK